MKKASYVIVGGGLPSLLFAYLLNKKDPSRRIVVIESTDKVGGLFKSTENNFGDIFDQGMHIYYETEILALDQAFLEILPSEDWLYLEGNRKDIAGIYYKGKLQLDTPYPDLRDSAGAKKLAFIQSLFQPLENKNLQEYRNALELLYDHFGETITNEIIEPILQKLYNLNSNQLDPLAFRLTAINRVALFSEQIVEDLMKSDYLRSRIAYPDQLGMRQERESSSRGIYPKNFGFGKVINKLTKILLENDVSFLFKTRIKELVIEENTIKYVICDSDEEPIIEIEKGVIWSADIFSLLKTLNEKVESKLKVEQKRYVNLTLDCYPNMGELYYFYNFDDYSEIFRVTNFTAYCPDATNYGRYPICVEYWAKDNLTEDQIKTKTIRDLIAMKVIENSGQILYAEVSNLPILFPTPSVEAIDSINEARSALARKRIENLVLTGSLSSKNVFFLHEVLKNGYESLREREWL